MFSSKTEPENTWVRVMGTSCADGSAGLMRPGGGLSTSSAGGRRPARGAQADRLGDGVAQAGRPERRSEEHTSELQSLMRISYAVFCLKKKNTEKHKNTHHLMITQKQ